MDLRPHIGDLPALKYSHNPIQRLPQSKRSGERGPEALTMSVRGGGNRLSPQSSS
jgi:hypothetical protein